MTLERQRPVLGHVAMLLVGTFLCLIGLTGCKDAIVAPIPETDVEAHGSTAPGTEAPGTEAPGTDTSGTYTPDPEVPVDAASGPTFRHMELLDQAVRNSGKDGGTVELVLGLQGLASADEVLHRYQLLDDVLHRYDFKYVFNGLAVSVPNKKLSNFLRHLRTDTDIRWVEPALALPKARSYSHANARGKQTISWGVLQTGALLSSARAGDGQGAIDGVDVYILDTGVSSSDVNVVEQRDFTDSEAQDKDGHGTHVAAIAGGIDNEMGTVGIAPGARVHSFKVVGPNNTADMATVVYAIDEVTRIKRENPSRPMVVSIALGANVNTSDYNSLDEAIQASTEAGVVYVVAAGNDYVDASNVTPAHTAEAITVGAQALPNQFAPFSNFGPAVDLLAPGADILAVEPDHGRKVKKLCLTSGTSMAAAHVVGAAALYLSEHPDATPAQVRDALVSAAKSGVSGVPSQTTNKALYVGVF
ncbi:MAG TPA: S8 family serine peptidase [Rhodothermales bacterium]|nr:S8 family serine peptidase [Rhodothermales bacterium]